MKKTQLSLCCMLMLVLTCQASAGLIVHYALDETGGTTAADSTGGNNGTVSNGTWITPGAILQTGPGCLRLQNLGSIQTSNLTAGVGDFTCMMWLKKTTSPRFPWLLGTTGGGANLQVCFEEEAATGKIEVGCGGAWMDTITAFRSGSWYHVAFVRQAATGAVKLYLNGVLEFTYNCGTANIDLSTLRIGQSPSFSDRYLNGDYDDFALWNEALPVGNIDGSEPGTINYYRVNGVSYLSKVQFEISSSGAVETLTPAVLNVKVLNPEAGQTYTVDYAVTGGTADGNDYTLAPGTLVFNPGETSKSINIDIINDGVAEPDETIIVTLSNPAGGSLVLGNPAQHTYTIADGPPHVFFGSSESIGAENSTPALVEVSLSHVSDKVVTVNYSVTGGTATGGGVDYNLAPGTLTFNPGETSKNISIDIADDTEKEDAETIILALSNPNNCTLGSPVSHTFTISDNEGGVNWDGSRWYYSSLSNILFVNPSNQLEWVPERQQFVTRIPTQSLNTIGNVVEVSYMWMTDGDHSCPSCTACPGCYDADITCLAGTGDMRVGLFEADGQYVEADGLGVSNSIFKGYKGYQFRFGPNMKSSLPTRWVDCTSETHKTGQIKKNDPGFSDILSGNDHPDLRDLPGFGLPPGEFSLFTMRLERTSSSSVKVSMTLNGKTYSATDGSSSNQPQIIDVLAVYMRNARPYRRLVLDDLCNLGPADMHIDDVIDGEDLGIISGDWLKEGIDAVNSKANLYEDDIIDLKDFAEFALQWLESCD